MASVHPSRQRLVPSAPTQRPTPPPAHAESSRAASTAELSREEALRRQLIERRKGRSDEGSASGGQVRELKILNASQRDRQSSEKQEETRRDQEEPRPRESRHANEFRDVDRHGRDVGSGRASPEYSEYRRQDVGSSRRPFADNSHGEPPRSGDHRREGRHEDRQNYGNPRHQDPQHPRHDPPPHLAHRDQGYGPRGHREGGVGLPALPPFPPQFPPRRMGFDPSRQGGHVNFEQ